MAMNPACKTFIPMLSPFIDGELSASDRVSVERHLAACRDCTGRAADLRAESGLLRVGLDMAADDVDFSDFTQKVMARITPVKPPLLERWRIGLSEMFTYQRGMLVSSMVTAMVLALVAVPLLLSRNGTPDGYASAQMRLQTVSTDQTAHVSPVVFNTDSGDAIIWMVSHDDATEQDEEGAGMNTATGAHTPAANPTAPNAAPNQNGTLNAPPQDAVKQPHGGDL